MAEYTVKIESWGGNYRPYRAKVYRQDGSYVGMTGGCTSPGRARDAARALIDADKR